MDIQDSIIKIKGIGEKKAKAFQKIGIVSIDDLIHYYPRDYEMNQSISLIKDLEPGNSCVIEVEVIENPTNLRLKALVVTRMRVKDTSGSLTAVWYQQPYLKKQFRLGQRLILKGKFVKKFNQNCIESPKIIHEEELERNKDQMLLPIYRLSGELTTKLLRESIDQGLMMMEGQIKDYLPEGFRRQYNLCEINYALTQIHHPENEDTLEVARFRLIFDEFLLFQLGMKMIKKDCRLPNKRQFSSAQVMERIRNSLPYQLTGAQQKVFGEIMQDLTGPRTMNRLVQGDVGSGKTILAALSLILAAENGYQSAMMAPTEVLAKQHYHSLCEVISETDFKVGLLVGSMTKKQKSECLADLKEGRIQILVGTHAVIQEGVEFQNLALVITDEQHRFGVKQRERLSGKAENVHVLVMSATPIPRTLALVVYGDMDVSVLDELPPGRQAIRTVVVNSGYRERIYHFMEKEIEAGRQCYIVCPMVEENEELDLQSVTEYTKKIIEIMPRTIGIATLHGKMKPSEKNQIMEDFVSGATDILVSTTVIEVGVNVPNATIMLIENAERFGLSGLHQLRGRVGRGKYQSHCILISDSEAELTKERLKVLASSNDGFYIAETDLKLRGPGDALGVKQHGLPELRIGSFYENMDILKLTGELAVELLSEDNQDQSEWRKTLQIVSRRYFESNNKQIAL